MKAITPNSSTPGRRSGDGWRSTPGCRRRSDHAVLRALRYLWRLLVAAPRQRRATATEGAAAARRTWPPGTGGTGALAAGHRQSALGLPAARAPGRALRAPQGARPGRLSRTPLAPDREPHALRSARRAARRPDRATVRAGDAALDPRALAADRGRSRRRCRGAGAARARRSVAGGSRQPARI